MVLIPEILQHCIQAPLIVLSWRLRLGDEDGRQIKAKQRESEQCPNTAREQPKASDYWFLIGNEEPAVQSSVHSPIQVFLVGAGGGNSLELVQAFVEERKQLVGKNILAIQFLHPFGMLPMHDGVGAPFVFLKYGKLSQHLSLQCRCEVFQIVCHEILEQP